VQSHLHYLYNWHNWFFERPYWLKNLPYINHVTQRQQTKRYLAFMHSGRWFYDKRFPLSDVTSWRDTTSDLFVGRTHLSSMAKDG